MDSKDFYGEQYGIRLIPRGENDPHVCMQILHEDDENWFPSENSVSSYWIPDFNRVWKEACEWIEWNCLADIDKEGHVWGYKFRS